MKLSEIKQITAEELIASIKNGRFTLDGSELKINGDFEIVFLKQLISLEGAPGWVGGDFYCAFNKLVSLKGAPGWVGGDFDCKKNKLVSLDGAPKEVGGDFYCAFNELVSLKGAPAWVGGDFDCEKNMLVSLEGAPKEVGGSFYCSINRLTTLDGAPMVVNGGFLCIGNKLTSLKDIHKHIKKINGVLHVHRNPISSHVLGVLLIQELKRIEMDNKKVERILNNYLPNTRGNAAVIDAQSELLDAGLEEFAQL